MCNKNLISTLDYLKGIPGITASSVCIIDRLKLDLDKESEVCKLFLTAEISQYGPDNEMSATIDMLVVPTKPNNNIINKEIIMSEQENESDVIPCTSCGGFGTVDGEECAVCHGSGTED